MFIVVAIGAFLSNLIRLGEDSAEIDFVSAAAASPSKKREHQHVSIVGCSSERKLKLA